MDGLNMPFWTALGLSLAGTLLPVGAVVGCSLAGLDDGAGGLGVHWSDSGVADGFAPTGVMFTVTLAISLLAVVVATLALLTPRCTQSASAHISGIAAGVSFFSQGMLLLSLIAGGASGSDGGTIVAVGSSLSFALALAWSFLFDSMLILSRGVRIHRLKRRVDESKSGFAWIEQIRGDAYFEGGVLLLGVAVAALVVWLFVPWPGLLVLTIASFAIACTQILFTRVRVVAGASGIRIQSLAQTVIFSIPWERVSSVRSEQIRAEDWAGWGLALGGKRSSYILRNGPALIICEDDGHELALTVGDPIGEAKALQAILSKR
ncbi:hypothetical protein E3O44_09075 [Cryobacterium algoricola]|uniref:DUF1648 domain-containing protein n=1 Tax=Cryobacterium algoricola TaxID=1259183 RepID=A0ABY2IF40_9MICO|nr:hypothetical protein [Cryobacterium algoricola]TFB87267.1 hypothetical protein E3O44_09075 [Cryobacterium algoricola]